MLFKENLGCQSTTSVRGKTQLEEVVIIISFQKSQGLEWTICDYFQICLLRNKLFGYYVWMLWFFVRLSSLREVS